jgi:hypothetical protein
MSFRFGFILFFRINSFVKSELTPGRSGYIGHDTRTQSIGVWLWLLALVVWRFVHLHSHKSP